MKKLTALFAALFVTAGISFAQSNEAMLDQTGDDNSSVIEQSMASESGAEVSLEGDNNSSTIEQAGKGHSAGLFSRGNDNAVLQVQHGAENQQRIELWGDDNSYTAEQRGDDNFIYLNARGTGPGLYGRAAADGNNNNTAEITQYQTGNVFSGAVTGSNNRITTHQDGNYNQIGGSFSASIPSAAPPGIPTGTYDFLFTPLSGGAWSGNGVNIYGNGNDVQIEQVGDYNTNIAFAQGDANKVVQRMTQGSGNTAVQAIHGSDNQSVIEQIGRASCR